MNRGLYTAMFLAGAVFGAAAAWRYARARYEKIAQKEIDSVREAFARREAVSRTEAEEKGAEGMRADIRSAAEQAKRKPDIGEYSAMIRQAGYDAYGNGSGACPYVITPDEFGEFGDYETVSLTWYADEVLADDDDEIVEDAEDIVGDALEHFGEYEDDTVFVRCDERKCDYEILLDRRRYSDVAGRMPRRVEVR